MRLSDFVIRALEANGISTAYVITGRGSLFLR